MSPPACNFWITVHYSLSDHVTSRDRATNMKLMSVSVVSHTHTIVPWSIVTVSNPSHKFSDLFQSLKAGIHPSVPTSRELCEAMINTIAVGRNKQSLSSIVGIAMNVMDVCQTFGNFVKFRVIPMNKLVAPTHIYPVKNIPAVQLWTYQTI